MTQGNVTGILELDGRAGGFIRQQSIELARTPNDPKIEPHIVTRSHLRDACVVEASVTQRNRQTVVQNIVSVNGLTPEAWAKVHEYSRHTAIDPKELIKMTTGPGDTSMRVIDLLCPIGKGQRALIVSPPKAGKTMLVQQIARSISTNHPEISLKVLLVDERPEEVTDMRRTIRGDVFASSSDSDRETHVRLAKIVLELSKREVETGKHVVLLLDSLTRMGRAFNAVQKSSGRTLSGGVDIRALEIPKKIFGAARALEGGGSLTIVATALIETGSRMDELIFQEFKGTGNMELVLSRSLADERIFPAIDIPKSGTRREELLFGGETNAYQALRRGLHSMKPREAMLTLQKLLSQYPTNRQLIARVQSGAVSLGA
jgi:transcription termination factor Rho